MNKQWTCAHGLTLQEHCEQCDKELAADVLRRWGGPVADAQKIVASAAPPELMRTKLQ